MFLTSSGKDKIDYLILSGGTARLEGLEPLLADELGVVTIVADPFVDMEIADSVDNDLLSSLAPQFMVATGLALRSFSSWHT